MDCRYGPQQERPVAYGEMVRLGEVDVSFVPAGHVLGSAQIVLEHGGERVVVSGDYKRRPDPTCAPFELGAVRHLHHRGDVRPAGLPPSRHRQRDRPAAAPAPRQSRALRAGRRLCAGQGAAGDHRAARPRPSRPDLHPRRAAAAVRALRGAWRAARRAAPGDRGAEGRAARAGSSSPRRARSTTAGRGACPIRSPRWPRAGCGSASAPGSAMSSCR